MRALVGGYYSCGTTRIEVAVMRCLRTPSNGPVWRPHLPRGHVVLPAEERRQLLPLHRPRRVLQHKRVRVPRIEEVPLHKNAACGGDHPIGLVWRAFTRVAVCVSVECGAERRIPAEVVHLNAQPQHSCAARQLAASAMWLCACTPSHGRRTALSVASEETKFESSSAHG